MIMSIGISTAMRGLLRRVSVANGVATTRNKGSDWKVLTEIASYFC